MTNIASVLEGRLGASRVELLREAARAASELGVPLYLVGGSVRDALRPRRRAPTAPVRRAGADLDVSFVGGSPKTPPGPAPLGSGLRRNDERPRRRAPTAPVRRAAATDPDVCVVSGAVGFASALAGALGGVASDRSQFGTAKLRVGGVSLDLVMARRESYAAPGALPTVEPGTLADDLARRDFSINAMAVSLSAESWGDLTDPFDGEGDLERRIIRVLHPSSFRDDATRLFRAARYAGRLGFRLEPSTERLAREGAAFIDTISGDRVRHELERIFEEPRAADILELADGLGLLRAIHPALRPAESPEAIEGERGPAMLAGLALGLSPREAEEVSARLNLGAEWARVVRDTAAVRELLGELESDLAPSRVYRLLHGRHEAALSAAPTAPVGRGEAPTAAPTAPVGRGEAPTTAPTAPVGRGEAPTAAVGRGAVPTAAPTAPVSRAVSNLRLYLSRLRHVSTSLSGGDIVAMGVPEGPRVGEVLRELLEARLDGVVESAEEERELASRRMERG